MEKPAVRILICDDDAIFQLAVKQALKGARGETVFQARAAYDTEEATAILRSDRFDVMLLDVHMRTEDEGVRAIPSFRKMDPEMAILMSSSATDFKTVREAMRLGAADYVAKDLGPEELEHAIRRIVDNRRLKRQTEQLNREIASHEEKRLLLGTSPAMQKLKKLIEKARPSQASVVITGETGSGKEAVARQFRRARPDGTLEPFVAIDASTIQGSLAESTLFGHEKGAFTGAVAAKKGLFEEADGGVAFLDEIGNMPLGIQAKLLRVLQEREVTRLGSNRPIRLDFRLICATNLDLEEQVERGLFKEDLYQRLNVLPVRVPPLRERRDDIPTLIQHFAELESPGSFMRFGKDCVNALKAYSWPGNVRELENVVAYLVTIVEGPSIGADDLPAKLRASGSRKRGTSFYERVEEFEKELLGRELERDSRNISRLASELGMDRSHLYAKMKKYGLKARDSD